MDDALLKAGDRDVGVGLERGPPGLLITERPGRVNLIVRTLGDEGGIGWGRGEEEVSVDASGSASDRRGEMARAPDARWREAASAPPSRPAAALADEMD
jgi:hypothetical protein